MRAGVSFRNHFTFTSLCPPSPLPPPHACAYAGDEGHRGHCCCCCLWIAHAQAGNGTYQKQILRCKELSSASRQRFTHDNTVLRLRIPAQSSCSCNASAPVLRACASTGSTCLAAQSCHPDSTTGAVANSSSTKLFLLTAALVSLLRPLSRHAI